MKLGLQYLCYFLNPHFFTQQAWSTLMYLFFIHDLLNHSLVIGQSKYSGCNLCLSYCCGVSNMKKISDCFCSYVPSV